MQSTCGDMSGGRTSGLEPSAKDFCLFCLDSSSSLRAMALVAFVLLAAVLAQNPAKDFRILASIQSVRGVAA